MEQFDQSGLFDQSGSSEARRWSTQDTHMLIEMMEQLEQKPLGTTYKVMFTRIAEKIADASGVACTHSQADSKWKSLKRTYKKIKKSHATSGSRKIHWQFFSLMEQFLGKKPALPGTCSTIAASQDEQRIERDADSDSPAPSSRKRKRTVGDAVDDVERRHQERMRRQDRFLDLFEKYIRKL